MMSRILAGVVFLLVSVVASVANAAILHGPVINPSNGRAYYLLEADTWQGSAAQANTLGGHLVVINDQTENDWVVATFGRFGGVSRNLWLGLSDAAKEGTFEWMTREPLTFTAWKSGEPNNSQEGANYAFTHAPGQEGVTGGGSWGNTLNTGDGGQIAFHGVVEADYLENDNFARWMGVAQESYRIDPWWIWPSFVAPAQEEQPNLRFWRKSAAGANARLNLDSKPNGSPSLQPYELVFEPAVDSSVLATWSSPMAGTFSVGVSFTDIDDAGDGQDVHVLIDGVEVFTSTVNAAEGKRRVTYTSPAPVQLKRGQSVSVQVGCGGAGHDAVGDVTRVDATVRYINTGVTRFEGTSGRLGLNDAGNLVLTLGTNDLTYNADGSLISKEPAAASIESIKSDYVQVTDGKVRKYSRGDGRLLWETPLDAGYSPASWFKSDLPGEVLLPWFKLDSQGNVLLPVATTGGSRGLIKYAAEDGQRQWVTTSYSTDIATDNNGDILTVDIDIFGAPTVTKRSGASGQFLWSKRISPLGVQRYFIIYYHDDKRNEWVYAPRFRFDSDNNPILFGSVNGVFLNGGLEEDVYAVKLEANTGKEFWQRIWRAPFNNVCWGALVNPQGDLILAQQGSFIRYKALPIDDQHFTFRGHSEAILHARVRVSDPQAKIYAEYGTDANYGMRTLEVPVPADGPVSVVLGGITAPNVYRYRLVVETSEGLVVGEEQLIDVPTVPNQTPVAKADAYVEPLASGLTQFVIDVLANDSDPEGDPLSIVSVFGGQYGTVKINGSNVVYTLGAGFSADTFYYTIADSYGAQSTAKVSVQAFNQYPPTVTDDVVQSPFGPVEFNVLTNDNDPEGKPLRVTEVTQPAHGTVTWYADGRMKYSPAAGFSGQDQFNYTVSDGVLQATGTVRVAVGAIDQPPIALDDAKQVGSGTTDLGWILSNDHDPDGKTLFIKSFTQPAHGAVTGLSPVPSGWASLSYTPVAGYSGEDQFTYVVSDGGLTAQATVRLTVTGGTNPENQPPLAQGDFAYVKTYPSSTDIWCLANDTDPEGATLVISSFTQPAKGSVVSIPGGLRYTPTPGMLGEDQFTYVVSDGSLAAQATVRVFLLANLPPMFGESLILASSGAVVPGAGESEGVPAGAKFHSFGLASINDRAEVAFTATFAVGEQSGSGVFAGSPLQLIARKGSSAPGAGGQPLPDGEIFRSFLDPLLNSRGDLAFLARISGRTQRNDSGLWLKPAEGSLQMVMREGEAAAGINGATWSAFISVGLTDSGAIPFVARLQVGKGGVTQANALGLWIKTASETSLLLRQGDWINVGGKRKQVRNFAALAPAKDSPGQGRVGPGEEVLARVSWSDRTQSLVKVAPGVAPEIIASTGDVVTGSEAKFASFGIPSMDKQGRFAVKAVLQKGEVAGISASNNVGVFTYTPAVGWATVTRKGPGPYWWNQLGDPVQNDEGITAFISNARGSLYEQIWRTGLSPYGLVGASGLDGSTELFPRSIVSFALPGGQESHVYLAKVGASAVGRPVASTSRIGLWAVNWANLNHLLCYEGQTGAVNGMTKTVRALDTLRMVPGSPAQPRSYNSKGQIISRVTFTDGTQSILQHQLP